jgi:hypothetical protein
MKPREKLLALGLAAVLALWQGGVLFRAFVIAPIEDRETDRDAREERIKVKKKELRASLAAAAKLKDWKLRSLPPDPVVATSLYQNWLVEIAKKTLSKPSIKPSSLVRKSKGKGDVFQHVSVEIEAEGTLAKLCDFLYEFRKAGLLHRVATMTLETDQHQGDPALKIKLTVEALALADAPERATLIADPKIAEIAHVPAKERKDYAPLVAKNLFVRGYNGPPKPPRTPGVILPGEEDPRALVWLVSVVSADGVPEAKLRDVSTNKKANLSEGSDFSVAGVDGKVVSIGTDFVMLEIKGETFRLELGDNLTQLKKLPSPEKTEAAPPETSPASGAGGS